MTILSSLAIAATDTELSISAATGYTDNALSAPASSTDGRLPENDFFFSVAPSFAVYTDTPRTTGSAGIAATLSRYVSQSGADTAAIAGTLALDHDASPTLATRFTLTGGYSRVPAVMPTGVVSAVPTGGAEYTEAGAGATLAFDLSRSTRLLENARATLHVPVGETATARSNLAFENALSVQRSERRDAIEARLLAGAHLYLDQVDGGGGADTHFGLDASWLRELSPRWRLTTSAGAAAVLAGGALSIAPLARLRVDHERTGTITTLFAEIAQGLDLNPLVAQTFSMTSAATGLAATLAPRLALTVSAGGAHSRAIGGGVGEDARAIDTLRASAAARWAALDNLSVTAGYDVVYQVGGAQTDRLLRNAVSVGVSASWPSAGRTRAPRADIGGLDLRREEDRAERERDAPR